MKVGCENPVVIDASVALKWNFQTEENSDKALKIRDDHENKIVDIIVPSIFFFEIANTMARTVPDEVTDFLSDIRTLEIMECRLGCEITSIAVDLMRKYPGISFYDTSYHALALLEGALFVTADEKYYKKLEKEGNLILLKDY